MSGIAADPARALGSVTLAAFSRALALARPRMAPTISDRDGGTFRGLGDVLGGGEPQRALSGSRQIRRDGCRGKGARLQGGRHLGRGRAALVARQQQVGLVDGVGQQEVPGNAV